MCIRDRDNETYLRELCLDGIKGRVPDADKDVYDRVKYELDMIVSMGFVDYFLIVKAVSYTHLDVYKRQCLGSLNPRRNTV